jgi:hypothetical protein
VTSVVTKSPVFWDIIPCRPLKANRRLGGTCCLQLQARRINQAENQREFLLATCFMLSFLVYYSTMKIKAICSSEASVDAGRTTRRYIREDRTLNTLRVLHGYVTWSFAVGEASSFRMNENKMPSVWNY